MSLEGKITNEKEIGIEIDPATLPQPKGSAFCWSLAVILRALGREISQSDVRGFTLSAFSIWAHPTEVVKIWQEPYAHLFVEHLLNALGLRGDILSLPEGEADHLGYFLNHWASRVRTFFKEGLPVGIMEAWPESLWGIATDWDPSERVLRGYIPGQEKKVKNRFWPTKLILVGKSSRAPALKASVRAVLREISALGANGLSCGKWVSGIDAYIIWKERAEEEYAKKADDHLNLALNLSLARHHAASFLSSHADFKIRGFERMMHSLARRYKRVSAHLARAASASDKLSFVNALTDAIAEEEKALALLDDLLFRLD